MSNLIKKLTQFFSLSNSVSTGLDAYIVSRNPQSVAEVEKLTVQYQSRGACGRIV